MKIQQLNSGSFVVSETLIPRKEKMAKAKKENVVEEGLVGEEMKSVEEGAIDKSTAPEESLIDQEVDILDVEKETGTLEEAAPEVEAIHEDTESAKELEKKAKVVKKTAKSVKKTKAAKVKSKKYQEIEKAIEINKIHSVKEAVELVKKASYTKFDATVSVAIRLEKSKSKKGEDSVRGTIKLPNGTGKKQNVVIVTDEIIEKIKKGWMDFDVLVATPAEMPKMAQVAKILGPKGKMPNPKDGTVVDDPKVIIEDLSERVVRYRADLGQNLHIPIGKTSWSNDKLEENLSFVLKSLIRFKKLSVTLSATMGPGIKVETK